MANYQSIAANLLPAVGYGDAAGLPFEAQPARPAHSVVDLQPVESNPFIGQYPAGTWSDDTHLSIAVAKSLAEKQGFDLESQAEWHIAAYNHVNGATHNPDLVPPIVTTGVQTGWGDSTTSSVKRLMEGKSPYESGQVSGAGNGVLMKMAPLALWQIADQTGAAETEQQFIDITRMTHDAPAAVVASLTHRYYLERLIDGVDPEAALLKAYDEAPDLEKEYKAGRGVSRVLGDLLVTDFLERPSRDKILNAAPRGGFYAPETLAMAYGSFVLEQAAPDSIFRAVELGGDSDSVGTIVAAMSAFSENAVPTEFPDYDKIFDRPRLEKISAELAAAI